MMFYTYIVWASVRKNNLWEKCSAVLSRRICLESDNPSFINLFIYFFLSKGCTRKSQGQGATKEGCQGNLRNFWASPCPVILDWPLNDVELTDVSSLWTFYTLSTYGCIRRLERAYSEKTKGRNFNAYLVGQSEHKFTFASYFSLI